MTGLRALLKKEFKEQLRTYRLLIVAGVFLIFGVGSPLLIYYLPGILEAAGETGFEMSPVTVDAFLTEFAGTVLPPLGFGMLAVLLVGMGTIARERSQGTAAMTLSKPVSRGAFILSKYVALASVALVSLIPPAVGCWICADIFYDDVEVSGFVALSSVLALYLLLMVAVIMFCGSLHKNQLVVFLASLVCMALLWVLALLPWIGDYAPGAFIVWGVDLATGVSTKAAWPAVVGNVVLVIVLLSLSCVVLRRKEL